MWATPDEQCHLAEACRIGRREHMTAWGPGNFEKDQALDFIGEEMDRHVAAIEAIFADSQRFQLDDTGDAEGELLPRVAILARLCEHCGGVFDQHNETDVGAWKARYLELYDDQIDGLEPGGDYKLQRRAVIADTVDTLIRLKQETFDTLIKLQQKERQRNEE
jgi:hypothetical protein